MYYASGLTGLPALFDEIAAALARDCAWPWAAPREELLHKLWRLESHLDEAVGTGDGYRFTLHGTRGRPVATVEVHGVRTSRGERVGVTSDKARLERVRTAIDGTGGSHTLGDSATVTAPSVELSLLPLPSGVPAPALGLSASAALTSVNSQGQSAAAPVCGSWCHGRRARPRPTWSGSASPPWSRRAAPGPGELERARAIVPIASVQNLYNVAQRDSEDVLTYAEANGIAFLPWFPLATGRLAEPGGPLTRIAGKLGATRPRRPWRGCCAAPPWCSRSPAPRRWTTWRTTWRPPRWSCHRATSRPCAGARSPGAEHAGPSRTPAIPRGSGPVPASRRAPSRHGAGRPLTSLRRPVILIRWRASRTARHSADRPDLLPIPPF
ncbi:hypothetical protein SFUMM280S_01411 [Streptomyces fumanus]